TDAALSTGGTLTVSDVDNADSFVAQSNVAGTNGTFNIGTDGVWTYVANDAFDSLNVGDSVSDTFTVASSDGTTTTVEVTINGTNDAATLSSATATLSETDAALSTGGTLTVSDVDNADSFVAQSNVAGTNGTFNIGTDGVWTYVANESFESLNVGDSVSDTFTVASSDGTTTTVEVTINGTNDAAQLSSATVALSETDAALSTGGTLTVSDIDNADTFVAQSNVAGTNGTFNINANGAWTFVANEAFDNLNVGDSVSDTFNVASSDGTTTTVQITINGTNDAAILSSASVSLTETDAALSTGGTLTVADVDNADTFIAQNNVAGTNGTFNIGTDGVWTYVAYEAFNSLNVGDSVSDTFTVASSDGTTTTVDVTINGTNDAATLSSATATLSETDAVLSTGGTLTVSDPDNADSFVAQSNVAGTNGTFNIGTDGVWTYVANDAFDSLNVGDSVSDTFTVASSDGTTSTVKVTINGTNDAPVATVDTGATVAEGAVITNTLNILSNDSDVDSADLVVSQFALNSNGDSATTANGSNTITTTLGGIVLVNEDGTFTYTAPASVDHTNSDTIVDNFFYKSSDSTAESDWTQVSINLTDTAPIAVNDFDNVGQGGHIYGNMITGTGGDGTGADSIGADTTQITSVVYDNNTYSNFVNGELTINAENGTLVVNQDGSYHYLSEPTSISGGGGDLSTWTNSGIDVLGFAMGESIFGNETDIGFKNNKGLYIDSPGNSDEKYYLDSTSNETESMVFDMNGDYSSVDITFREFHAEDQIQWQTFDSNRQPLESGVINNSSHGSGGRKEATFTFEPDSPFQYIAIQGTDVNDEFNIWSMSNAVAVIAGTDSFSYTLTDQDGDISTANLSITHQNTTVANSDTSTVYESGLTTGTDPGSSAIIATGNLLANDDGITGTTSVTEATFNEITAEPVGGIITIDTPQGILTIYTVTENGHTAGDYSYTLQEAGDPIEEVFNYQLTDSNTNETSDSTLTIDITDDLHVITGTSAGETLTGGDYSDLINANGGDDTLFGGLGPDILSANDGDDVLIGGAGDDTMTGGSGSDRFVWNIGDDANNPNDVITDFVHGANGDILDLSNLLSDASSDASSLDSFLQVSYQEGEGGEPGSSVIAIDPNGDGAFDPSQSVTLTGVDLTSGGSLSNQDILSDLLINGNLVVE
ncbi:MAG: VCBS domain-containing protein, partial [Legionellaceae bacterium]|nr:VCBS domain-containing protein [Legionellaceae bacterium]